MRGLDREPQIRGPSAGIHSSRQRRPHFLHRSGRGDGLLLFPGPEKHRRLLPGRPENALGCGGHFHLRHPVLRHQPAGQSRLGLRQRLDPGPDSRDHSHLHPHRDLGVPALLPPASSLHRLRVSGTAFQSVSTPGVQPALPVHAGKLSGRRHLRTLPGPLHRHRTGVEMDHLHHRWTGDAVHLARWDEGGHLDRRGPGHGPVRWTYHGDRGADPAGRRRSGRNRGCGLPRRTLPRRNQLGHLGGGDALGGPRQRFLHPPVHVRRGPDDAAAVPDHTDPSRRPQFHAF